MAVYIVILVVVAALVIPFIPGWIELKRPKDADPLPIDMEYTKDPFFFGTRFAGLLLDNLPASDELESREYVIRLSRPETVLVKKESWRNLESRTHVKPLLYVDGGMEVGDKARFDKEVFVSGDVSIGEYAEMQALLCHGSLTLGRGARVRRWLDGRGAKVLIGPDCDLGRNTVSSRLLELGEGVRFIQLYGMPIHTYSAPLSMHLRTMTGDLREAALVVADQWFSVPRDTQLRCNIVCRQNLKLYSGCTVEGDIKGYHAVELEDDVTVNGNIVAEGDIVIGRACRVTGNLFSQGSIVVNAGSSVGAEGSVRSLVGKRKIELSCDVVVYGFIAAENGGRVRPAGKKTA